MKLVGTESIYQGDKFSFNVRRLETSSGMVELPFIDHPGAVVIVPLLENGRLVMIRNYRHAVDKVLWELPAGTRQPGEPFEEAARRELKEETGYRAGTLDRRTSFFPAPGCSNELMHVYVARELTPGDQECEIDERIQVEVVDFEQAWDMTTDGRIMDAKTMLGIWHCVPRPACNGG